MDSLSAAQRLWRLAAASVSLWIAYSILSNGPHPTWPVAGKVALGIAVIFLVLYALGTFVQAIQVQADDEERIRWFPESGDRGRLLRVIGLELMLILVVGAIGIFRPDLGERAIYAGIGVWVMYLAISANPGFLPDSRSDGEDLRDYLAGRVAIMIYVGLGLAVVAFAIFAL